MITLIQRVLEASVCVEGETVGAIGPGILALVAVEKADSAVQAGRLAERILGYRVFEDGQGRMNLSVADIGGACVHLLWRVVTLLARSGRDDGEPLHAAFSILLLQLLHVSAVVVFTYVRAAVVEPFQNHPFTSVVGQ